MIKDFENKFCKKNIEAKLVSLICDLLELAVPVDIETKMEDLGLDEFDTTEIILLLEEWLAFCIDDENISKDNTISEVAEIVFCQLDKKLE